MLIKEKQKEFLAFFVFICFLLIGFPFHIPMRGDDFAYLESMILTFKNHWPTTSDWLEPNNVFPETLSALLYWITKNVYWSTTGIVLFFNIIFYFVLRAIFRLLQISNYFVYLALCLLNPFVLNQLCGYGGPAFYLVFFFSAVFFYFKDQNVLFFLMLACAFFCRESGITLLAFPLWDLLTKRKKIIFKTIQIIAVTVFLFVLKKHIVNSTYVQINSTQKVFSQFSLTLFLSSMVMTIQYYAFFCLIKDLIVDGMRIQFNRKLVFHVVVAVTICFLPVSMAFGTPFFYKIMSPLSKLISFFGTIYFLQNFSKFLKLNHFTFLIYGIMVLISIRGIVWEHYLIEISCLSIMSQVGNGFHFRKKSVFAYVGFCLFYALVFSYYVQRSNAAIELLEPLQRSGSIRVEQVSNAPFGYSAWYLYAPRVDMAGKEFAGINYFNMKISNEYKLVWSDVPNAIAQKKVNFLFYQYAVSLVRADNSEILKPKTDMTIYHAHEYFPLNKEEWRKYIWQF